VRASSFLLDTNILIPVEDSRPLPATYAKLLHDLQARGHSTFVHAASEDDLRRDADARRREISLSKLARYRRLEKGWRTQAQLELEFGRVTSDNDRCDCELLAALADGLSDFLVTEDNGLHARARSHGFDQRVLYVRQALDLINDSYADLELGLRSIDTKFVYQLNPSDPIFDSLRLDYDGFDEWIEKCRQRHRRCWVAFDVDAIAGLVIYKDEQPDEVPPGVVGQRILKLCTFKTGEAYRGGRLGEQLLRQSMCFAFEAQYESIYLTVYEKQTSLINLLEFYGFELVGAQENGELVYSKAWDRQSDLAAAGFEELCRAYPMLPDRFSGAVVVPILPQFHDRLFPEAAARLPGIAPDLFAELWHSGNPESSIPSNSIRKTYLSNARLQRLDPGALVAFYRSQDDQNGVRGSLTAIGVAEDYSTNNNYESALRKVAKRSVYRAAEIEQMVTNWNGIKILQFLFYGYLAPPITLKELVRGGVLNGPPQSIVRLGADPTDKLLETVRATLVFG